MAGQQETASSWEQEQEQEQEEQEQELEAGNRANGGHLRRRTDAKCI